LSHICKTSVESGICPDKLKKAKLIHFYNNRGYTQHTDYRPVSCLSVIYVQKINV